MKSLKPLIVVSALSVAFPAAAQDTPPPAPASTPPPTVAPATSPETPTPQTEPAATEPAPTVAEPAPRPEPEATPEPEAALQSATSGDDEPIYRRGGLFGAGIVIAPKFGIGFGQPFSDFGTSPVAELELGWVVLPFPDLQIFTTLQFVNPKQEGGGNDPRLPGDGSWTYELAQQSLVLTPGLLYRIPVGGALFRPYASAGPRFYFNKTTVAGTTSSGEAFGEYTEKGSSIGLYGGLGADLFVGPGSVLLELQFGWSKIDQYVLQDTNNSALNLALGYRFFL